MAVLLFSVPPYSVLYSTTILHPPASYSEQFNHLDPEYRRQFRYGNSYDFYKKVQQAFEQGGVKGPVILLPPQKYLDEMGVVNVSMSEPSAFYYYTGLRAVWANSPDAEQGRWTFEPKPPVVTLKKIENKEDLDRLLKRYRPYLQHQ